MTRAAAQHHVLALHCCLHRALKQAVTWRLVARNAAIDATPPLVPPKDVAALFPDQLACCWDAATRALSPWLGTWTAGRTA